MLKVTNTGKNHGDSVFVCGVDHFLIADGASGLDDRGDSRLSRRINGVAEGEKASDAMTHPLTSLFAFSTASRAESTRLIWPAPMPTVSRSRA